MEKLERIIIRHMAARKQTLALAESCTGGFIANLITNVPGASKVLLGGVVAYSNTVKRQFLGVQARSLARHGAVSRQVAVQMAAGARKKFGADFAVSVTGIAGPSGGTKAKPRGTVFIAVACSTDVLVERKLNRASRQRFKKMTARQALKMLKSKIEK